MVSTVWTCWERRSWKDMFSGHLTSLTLRLSYYRSWLQHDGHTYLTLLLLNNAKLFSVFNIVTPICIILITQQAIEHHCNTVILSTCMTTLGQTIKPTQSHTIIAQSYVNILLCICHGNVFPYFCTCATVYFVTRYLFLQSGKAHQVTQFHIVNWDPDGRCSNLRTITDVIKEATKVQMRTGNHPIVVHCRWRGISVPPPLSTHAYTYMYILPHSQNYSTSCSYPFSAG